MSVRSFKIWMMVHKWSSLICTLFLLMLCATGLPLIFHDEIESFEANAAYAEMTGPASAKEGEALDRIVARAVADAGGGVPLFVGFSQDNPIITVTIGPTANAAEADMRLFSYNRQTGAAMGEIREEGVMHFLLQLHTDMFLGLPGMLFLGVMGVLFVLALVSGVVLYAPFMRRLPFGTLRSAQSVQVRRLDYHNMLGIVTLGWALVVGITGVINAFADPLTDQWRNGALTEMVADYAGQAPLAPADYGSIDTAMASAKFALPGQSPQFIGFPGGTWSSAHHYAIFFQGDTPLTSHVLTPALVDARTGALTDHANMPVMTQALMLSKPLHFGDYGGLPLKLIWAWMTLATIWVLITGLQLWWRKRARSGGADLTADLELSAAE